MGMPYDSDSQKVMLEEVKLIQDVIKRMASNSFIIKGWAITLVVATLLLKGAKAQVLIAFIPTISFWYLDAYFLRQERMYRKLYEWVIGNRADSKEFFFDLNANRFKDQVASVTTIMASQTLAAFYGTIAFIIILYGLVLLA